MLRRPVALVALILTVISMGVLTYKARRPRSRRAARPRCWRRSGRVQGFVDSEDAVAGAALFAESGLNCHVYLDAGASSLQALPS